MLSRLRLGRGHYALACALMLLALTLVSVVFYTGFSTDGRTTPSPNPYGEMLGFVDYTGQSSLEERIAGSDVVARVKLVSVAQVVEKLSGYEPMEPTRTSYVNALEFKFEVLEYLKGSGGSELTAVALDWDATYETEQAAAAGEVDFLGWRDTRWDEREAIVFLGDDNPLMPSSKQTDRYSLGYLRAGDEDRYTIASRHDRPWLPAASAGDSIGALGWAVSALGIGEQRFLLEEPSGGAWASDRSQTQTQTITLSELKTRIAELAQEVAKGDGSEEYRECIHLKYRWEREVLYIKGGSEDGEYYYKRHDREIDSGLPAGSEAYVDPAAGYALYYFGETPSSDLGEYRIIGRDKDLFIPQWPGVATLVRPLPAGEYKFYFSYRWKEHIICDAHPEAAMKRHEVFVTVTPPAGTLHEAFFDPVAIGTAVGADGSNGALEPASFTVGARRARCKASSGRTGPLC